MKDRIAIICPMGRDNVGNLAENLERQVFKNFAPIVIENGPGVGSCERYKDKCGWKPAIVLQSGKHPGIAKNAGLKVARDAGFDRWATFDDDDYYGPLYLEELHSAFQAGHRVVGKCANFTALSTGEVILLDHDDSICRHNMAVDCLNGPTISAKFWDKMPMFDERMPWGEDVNWCDDVVRQGIPIWATSIFNWCYMRHSKSHLHTYPMDDEQLLAHTQGSIYDVGGWGTGALRTINGQRESIEPLKIRRARPMLDFDTSPTLQAYRMLSN